MKQKNKNSQFSILNSQLENNSQFLIYQTENGETGIDVRFQDETVWLTQKTMAELKDIVPIIPNENILINTFKIIQKIKRILNSSPTTSLGK